MDIAKPDSLFLCLILLAFFIGQRYPSRPGMMTSGLLFVSAYYTKMASLLTELQPFSCALSLPGTRTGSQLVTG